MTDAGNRRVQKFTEDGRFVLQWGGEGLFEKPPGIAVAPDGSIYVSDYFYPSRMAVGPDDLVYVADSYNNRIQVFTPEGQFVRKWGGMGLWGGRFRVASAIAFDPQGHVHVADFYNHRIQVFESNGAYLTQWAKDPSFNPPLKGPTGLAINGEGNSYVIDFHHHRVLKFFHSDTQQKGMNGD